MKPLSLLNELGIPGNYGETPHLPVYAEAADLVDVGPNIVGHPQSLAGQTARDWFAMRSSAERDGIELLLVSGFRSVARQADIIRRKLEAGQSMEQILAVNVAPGFSQHHTGKAIDIATRGCPPLTESFEETPAFAWLLEHASEHGFTLPYGRDNAYGITYEPWHWSQIRD